MGRAASNSLNAGFDTYKLQVNALAIPSNSPLSLHFQQKIEEKVVI